MLTKRTAPRRPAGRRIVATIGAAAIVLSGLAFSEVPATAAAQTVALVGSLQSELGCTEDWQPACASTELAPTGVDGVWSAEFTVPAGSYDYKVALNDTWDVTYGLDGGADNIPLTIAGESRLSFTFDLGLKRVGLEVLSLAGAYSAEDEVVAAAPIRQPGSDEQFYFVMTDRFEDADPANNTAGLGDDPQVSGYDPADKGFYNGGDLAGLHSQLDYIEGLGTSALWLTPSFKNRPVQGEGENASAGYHGYWITDFTQIDPHLGTNAELKALIDDAHTRGIKVYFDIITNHTADVIDYEEQQYSYIDKATSPYTTAAGEPFDPADYAGTDEFPTLDSTSFPYTPYLSAADAAAKVPAWLNDPTLYHNRGDSTFEGESALDGDFSGLDDLMTENPAVVNGFVDVYTDWVDLGIDGFRIDTVKHVNLEFWETWSTQVLDYAHAAGKPDFFMFGEVYDADAAKTSPYVRKTDLNSVLDFGFQSQATSFAAGNSAKGLSQLFASDDLYTTPDSNAYALPTFLGNHDMGRIGYFLKNTDDPLARDILAHELMFLTRGQPVVYYGDEQGFMGTGGDKDARQSMFASQVAEYVNQPLITGETAGSVDRFATDAPLYARIAELSALRSDHPALATGAQIERYADTGAGIYAFSRVDRTEKIEHLVAVNNSAAATTVTIPTLTTGASYSVLFGDTAPAVASDTGDLAVTVPARGSVVLVADRTVSIPAAAAAITLAAPAAGAGVTGVSPVGATVDEGTWQETGFAWRVVGDSAWTSLGTAEDTTPRVFHDTAGLAPGTLVEYRAVSTDAAGQRAAASSFASVGNTVSLADTGTPDPAIDLVTVAGSHNSEMGCAGDWQPGCEAAKLTLRADGIYAGTFDLPAGDYEYKIAVNGSWDLNYGSGGVPGGANVSYTTTGGAVTFYFDPRNNFFQSTAEGDIVVAAGSFQEEAGCPGDWQPDCLATWLQDVDGDGILTLSSSTLPTGSYEAKVAHNLGWDENYGVDGVPNGANLSFAATEGKETLFSYDLASHVLTILVTDPPLAGTGQQRAQWVSEETIAWPRDLLPVNADPASLGYALHSSAAAGLSVVDGAVTGGDTVALEYDPAGLSVAEKARFPALAASVALRPVGLDRSAVERLLTTQLAVAQSGTDDTPGTLTAFTGVQLPGVLDDLYAAAAADRALGVTWSKKLPTIAVWAPTAQNVDALVWTAGDTADPERIALERQDDGSWTATGARNWTGASFVFEVTVFAPTTGTIEVNQVTDPYSVALTPNSTRSVLIDLADKAYRPKVWEQATSPVIEKAVDRSIYELHVRDFSISDDTVPDELRGTYGAFGVDSAGTRHLAELADAGLNTVHLLPTFDIATIEEDRALQAVPACDLASFGPASPEQQACIQAIKDQDGFNWGYDPFHFSVPEGSYAVNAEGGARVAEFRGMVGALHEDGLQVVLDEVFNHTAQSGQGEKSVLDQVVPGYYHRLNPQGAVETSTCCQNIATEHELAEKLMVDSVVLWAKEYRVDGFRFDLMGHHSKDNLLAVRDALDALTLKKDGVNGQAIYLYGEGWNFGEVANNALFEQATQGQLGGTGIGTFNDRLRDAVHGGSPVDGSTVQQQGFGTGLGTDPNGVAINGTPEQALARLGQASDLVRLGLAANLRDFSFVTSDGTRKRGDELDYNGSPAGYADQPDEVINYVDAHDNETLYDLLALKLPADTGMSDRVRMNTLSLATATLSQSPSLWHAGTDLLRSKSLDRDSYNSGDWFNRIDWTGQTSNFGVGLPSAAANEDKWPIMRPLLEDPALKPTPDDIAFASAQAQDLLRLKQSTELFRLGDAKLINQKLTFPGSGPDATPGVIAMSVDDTVGFDVDKNLDGLLVLFNASPAPQTIQLSELAGRGYALSGIQAAGTDALVRTTMWDAATGTVTVPARTVAVLLDAQERTAKKR